MACPLLIGRRGYHAHLRAVFLVIYDLIRRKSGVRVLDASEGAYFLQSSVVSPRRCWAVFPRCGAAGPRGSGGGPTFSSALACALHTNNQEPPSGMHGVNRYHDKVVYWCKATPQPFSTQTDGTVQYRYSLIVVFCGSAILIPMEYTHVLIQFCLI